MFVNCVYYWEGSTLIIVRALHACIRKSHFTHNVVGNVSMIGGTSVILWVHGAKGWKQAR